MTDVNNQIGRPDKVEAIAIKKRNEELVAMDEKGYPLDFLANYFNLTKGRVVQILKEEEENTKKL